MATRTVVLGYADDLFDEPFRLVDTMILASLSRKPRHAYELEAHVVNMTIRRVAAGNATVYKAVKRLARAGLVVQLAHQEGERRRYYDITEAGRAQLGRNLMLMRRILEASLHPF